MEDVTRNPQLWIFFGSRFVVFLILIQKKKQWFEKCGVKVLCIGGGCVLVSGIMPLYTSQNSNGGKNYIESAG